MRDWVHLGGFVASLGLVYLGVAAVSAAAPAVVGGIVLVVILGDRMRG